MLYSCNQMATVGVKRLSKPQEVTAVAGIECSPAVDAVESVADVDAAVVVEAVSVVARCTPAEPGLAAAAAIASLTTHPIGRLETSSVAGSHCCFELTKQNKPLVSHGVPPLGGVKDGRG